MKKQDFDFWSWRPRDDPAVFEAANKQKFLTKKSL